MKTLNLVCIVATALLSTSTLRAQILKWEYRATRHVITYNGDGYGGLAICEEQPGQKVRCVWIASNGRQFTNEFDYLPDTGTPIVRLTPFELAIQFRTKSSDSDAVINMLRRFRKTKRGITITNKILGPENLPLVMPQMTDPFGFFTTGITLNDDGQRLFTIRRYSN